jgi:hypothetical protein
LARYIALFLFKLFLEHPNKAFKTNVSAHFTARLHSYLFRYVRILREAYTHECKQIYQYLGKHFFKLSPNDVFVKIKTPEFMPKYYPFVKIYFIHS